MLQSFALTFHVFQRERPSQQQSSGFTRISSRSTLRTKHSEWVSTRCCRILQTGKESFLFAPFSVFNWYYHISQPCPCSRCQKKICPLFFFFVMALYCWQYLSISYICISVISCTYQPLGINITDFNDSLICLLISFCVCADFRMRLILYINVTPTLLFFFFFFESWSLRSLSSTPWFESSCWISAG